MHFHISSIEHWPTLVEAYPRRCFGFLALSSFQSPLCGSDTLCNYNPYNQTMHPTQPPFPHHVTLALFAIGSSSHGCFAFVHHPAVALFASAATCAVMLFGSRVGIVLVVIGYVFVFPALLCFCDKPYPLLLTFPPSHTRDKCRRLSMCSTDLNKFFQCLCFVNPHYTSCSITCSFSRYSLHPISSLQCVFLFHFLIPLVCLPFGTHLQNTEDVCILADIDVYTSALSAISTSLGLFIRQIT